jgi:hypothetical protein
MPDGYVAEAAVEGGGGTDAAASDAGVDAASDGGIDAASDAGIDAGADAADAEVDASDAQPLDASDAEVADASDAETTDASDTDAASDAEVDAADDASDAGGGVDASNNNLITNGDFSNGITGWNLQNGTVDTSSGAAACITPTSSTISVVFGWPDPTGTGFSLTPGLTYTLTFDAWANVNMTCITDKIGESLSPFSSYAIGNPCLTTVKTTYQLGFTATATDTIPAGIAFLFTKPTTDTICITNVSVTVQ